MDWSAVKFKLFKKKSAKKATVPVQQAPISIELSRLTAKVDQIGQAVKGVHANTVPAISWLPAIAASIILLYPVEQFILSTAPDYKVSAWLSGYIADAKKLTATYALNSGIQFAGGSVTYAAPLKGKLTVTSHYNKFRKHPRTGLVRPHNGTDYRCDIGDPVYAMRSGIVAHAESSGNAGNMVVIKHSNGESSVYMHLNQINVRFMEKLSTGENIGECGATGRVTGPHLHVEIRKPNNKPMNPIKLVNIEQSTDMWPYFKEAVAQSESQGSGGYKARTPSGTYNGKYQMGREALTQIGLGHITWNKFLSAPALQEVAYRKWQAANLQSGRHGIHMTAKTGKRIDVAGFITNNTPAYKVAGYLHAAQFGATNALKWYTQKIDFTDGNGVKISDYAERGETAFKAKYGRLASAAPLMRAIER